MVSASQSLACSDLKPLGLSDSRWPPWCTKASYNMPDVTKIKKDHVSPEIDLEGFSLDFRWTRRQTFFRGDP